MCELPVQKLKVGLLSIIYLLDIKCCFDTFTFSVFKLNIIIPEWRRQKKVMFKRLNKFVHLSPTYCNPDTRASSPEPGRHLVEQPAAGGMLPGDLSASGYAGSPWPRACTRPPSPLSAAASRPPPACQLCSCTKPNMSSKTVGWQISDFKKKSERKKKYSKINLKKGNPTFFSQQIYHQF